MGLHSLRKQFGIIPQTPFIFKGSIRYNIDPKGFLSDDEIWTAFNKAGLSEYIKNVPIFLCSFLISFKPKYQAPLRVFPWARNSF